MLFWDLIRYNVLNQYKLQSMRWLNLFYVKKVRVVFQEICAVQSVDDKFI
jgi:hypothetical protein